MSEPTIYPSAVGGCTYDDCPQYDGKRCRLTGFRPAGCEPAYDRLRSRAESAERLAAERLEVLRSLVERGPCPVCHSEGECAPDCRLAAALGRASGAGEGT